jgi:hypothetical protein
MLAYQTYLLECRIQLSNGCIESCFLCELAGYHIILFLDLSKSSLGGELKHFIKQMHQYKSEATNLGLRQGDGVDYGFALVLERLNCLHFLEFGRP